jgi:hypothetical protein
MQNASKAPLELLIANQWRAASSTKTDAAATACGVFVAGHRSTSQPHA